MDPTSGPYGRVWAGVGRVWVADQVRVRVPATSANLGPGFDSLGLALALHDEVEVELTGGGLTLEVFGEGAEVADRGEGHLIVQVLRQTFEHLDALAPTALGQPAGLRLRCHNRIPHSRGLGSSSAATVAGITAARALHPYGRLLDDTAALELAAGIEGHPDNVAPCLMGGLTICWAREPGQVRQVRMARLRPAIDSVVVFVPDQQLATERARGLLPDTVPHGAAAANAGRAALLVAALTGATRITETTETTGATESTVLLDATEDWLHQPYRAAVMPESAALVKGLRAAGVPAVISGAGPTVLAFTSASRVDSIDVEVGNAWHKHALNVDPCGAHVELGDGGSTAPNMQDLTSEE